MKAAIIIASLAQFIGLACAHYNFPTIIYNNVTYKHWQYVRRWSAGNDYGNQDDYTPIESLSLQPNPWNITNQLFNIEMRCNVNSTLANETLTVNAGSDLGFQVHTGQGGIGHPGPMMAYMAKVPAGKTAQNWDGDGNVWFKISEDFPVSWTDYPELNFSAPVWSSIGATEVHFRIPQSVPNGEYLFRVEHVGLHAAYDGGTGAQFFISCAQINVNGGGAGKPGPLVAFPGAYNFSDPIITARIYTPPDIRHEDQPFVKRTPGPPVWHG